VCEVDNPPDCGILYPCEQSAVGSGTKTRKEFFAMLATMLGIGLHSKRREASVVHHADC
jgi:hypothetical protein